MKDINEVLDFIHNKSFSRVFIFSSTGFEQNLLLEPGVYCFECWGASGKSYFNGVNFRPGGNGSYAFGLIRIDSPRKVYIHVGKGSSDSFGGGGHADFPGGGASDIRIFTGDSFESLKSRIIVAAGGGGADSGEGGGNGGTLTGGNSELNYSLGATQTSPGVGYINGNFGTGGGVKKNDANSGGELYNDGNGGGGGGYYGGGSGKTFFNYGGSGGSSFVSGYPGCDAISPDSSSLDSIVHKGSSGHYSGFVFFDSFISGGGDLIPKLDQGTQIGNNGDGIIRISLIDHSFINFNTCHSNSFVDPLLFVFLSLTFTT